MHLTRTQAELYNPLMGNRPQTVTEFGEEKYWFSVWLLDFLGTAVIVALIPVDLD